MPAARGRERRSRLDEGVEAAAKLDRGPSAPGDPAALGRRCAADQGTVKSGPFTVCPTSLNELVAGDV